MYHASNYRNREETLLIKNIFDWLQDNRGITNTDFDVEFVHPEKRIVKLKSPAKGILFKEVRFPKWRAYMEREGKREKLDIYVAGPDFMYIPLYGADLGDNVVLEYKKIAVDYIAYFVSLATFILLILWVFDWWIVKPYALSLKNKMRLPFIRFKEWWNRE